MINFMDEFDTSEIELYLSNNYTEPEALINAKKATFLTLGTNVFWKVCCQCIYFRQRSLYFGQLLKYVSKAMNY